MSTVTPSRSRVVVITGDPVGEKMAGPAIRAWHIARELAEEHEVRLLSMNRVSIQHPNFEILEISHHRPSSINEHEAWADVIILQGHALALFPALERTEKVLVVDIYDPLHLEQLEQGRELPTQQWVDQVRDATASLNHQLQLGDYFLCASELQRNFWLGQLAGVGRVNPYTYQQDNDLDRLIGIAPFGIAAVEPERTRPAIKGVVPGIGVNDTVIIWAGGIYNWFDPETLIRAVGLLADSRPDLRLFFMGVKHPNPDVPEMDIVARCRRLADELGLTGRNVFFNESWVDFDDRQNYLLDADLGVSTHFQHIETTFSFRTRILDYLWAGLPIVSTDGDSFASLVSANGLGRVVQERDEAGLAAALEDVLYDDVLRADIVANVGRIREDFRWSRTLRPLVEFCRAPSHAADRLPPNRHHRGAHGVVGPRVIRAGWRRDVGRTIHYLRAGGVRAVYGKVAQRVRKRSAE
ncbi:glycosyltransferase family 4 protein [Leifsonia sp. YIM 134122]|uniref:Glycosyltransferase family 4 protein n=1 Tax=Leifsonia stereocauli TaxID=3134136 RepID=A0ABU9W3I2_9MICO